jgi:FMN reductase
MTSHSPLRVLAIQGSSRRDGRLERLMALVIDAARTSGADVELLRLAETNLPILGAEDSEQMRDPAIVALRERSALADAFLIGTPEYHGTMSGALKNWFDYHYEEFAGKLAAVVASTGGGTGDMSITAVKNCVMWCHGFVLPFHVAAQRNDFDDQLNLASKKVEDRAQRLGHDLVRYGAVLRQSFAQALTKGSSSEAGFAGFHRS